MKIEINEQFAKALQLMEEGKRDVFITGKAGTGKSTLLSHFRQSTSREVVVVAPTGVAAVNVGAQTMHSFFGFRPDVTVEKARYAAKKATEDGKTKLYRMMETLIIDEISMVRADLFDCADQFLRTVRETPLEPFGGVRVIMIGDLYQLPPVVTSRERDIFSKHYMSPFFFDSKVYPEMEISVLELEKIYRQHDELFIDLLGAVRNNTIDHSGLSILNSRVATDVIDIDDGAIYLTALNREADEVNEAKLAKLKGRSRRYEAELQGDFDEKAFPADPHLSLKVGAQVMMLNNDQFGRWVNGTIGRVVAMRSDSIDVELQDGSVEEVEPHNWQMFSYEFNERSRHIVSEPVGNFIQLPVMLAWAVTIHKSQGKTFDNAVIDAGRAFAPGQVYVALSRLRTLEGIRLAHPLKRSHLRVDWRVVRFLTSHRYAASEHNLPLDKKIAIIERAISEGQKLEIVYLKANDTRSKRVIRPLEVGEMYYDEWSFIGLHGICELRHEERSFRVDRILEMRVVK